MRLPMCHSKRCWKILLVTTRCKMPIYGVLCKEACIKSYILFARGFSGAAQLFLFVFSNKRGFDSEITTDVHLAIHVFSSNCMCACIKGAN